MARTRKFARAEDALKFTDEVIAILNGRNRIVASSSDAAAKRDLQAFDRIVEIASRLGLLDRTS